MEKREENHFLGIDLSTQQLKCVIIEGVSGNVVHRDAVNFSRDLPDFGTTDGVMINDDGQTVTSPVKMWLRAIDILFDRLHQGGKLGKIRGISGCAQQHGTVYWLKFPKIQSLSSLEDQIDSCFALRDSPIWMDSSTGLQCQELENVTQGPEQMAILTGSRAHHRFSGAQIKKIVDLKPEAWAETERVSLISSFLASLFIGKYAAIDTTDGSGMNLMDVRKKQWIPSLLLSISDDLEKKLGALVDPMQSLGPVHNYWSERYNIPGDCQILPFLGDNPASLAGLSLLPSDIAISLGTSDTVFFATSSYQPSIDAHVFAHFAETTQYMAMVCFKNGSLTREKARVLAGCEWEQFGSLLEKTSAGNDGNLGFFFDSDEIAPRVKAGYYLFDRDDQTVGSFELEHFCRAVFESQCLLKLAYTKKMGFEFSAESRILVTGGASRNSHILQMLADVFGCNVFTAHIEDSAALGGAMRARYVHAKSNLAYHEFHQVPARHVATPNMENFKIYEQILPRFENLMQRLLNE